MTRSDSEEVHLPENVLVTDFPSPLSLELVAQLLEGDDSAHVFCLTEDVSEELALEAIRQFPATSRERISILKGAAGSMDLGLSGNEYQRLKEEITVVHYLCPPTPWSKVELSRADETKQVIEFCSDLLRLRRFCFWSSVFVSGKREGVIRECELREGQSFSSLYEEALFRSEVLADSSKMRIPTSIFRTGIILPGAKLLELPKNSNVETLQKLLQFLGGRTAKRSTPITLSPLEYVVKSAIALAQDEIAVGRTFHLISPGPVSIRTMHEFLGKTAGGRHTQSRPVEIARGILRPSGRNAFYCDADAQAFLKPIGIVCSSIHDHLELGMKQE